MSANALPPHLAPLAPALRRLRRRLNTAVWLELALPWWIGLTGAAAGTQIAAKLIWPAAGLWPMAALALLPLPALTAIWQGARLKRFFSFRELAEVADHLYHDDGALSSAWENPRLSPGDWTAVRAALHGRAPRLRWMWHLRRLAPSLACLALAAFMPPRKAQAIAGAEGVAAVLTQPIAEKLAANEELIPEDEKQSIEQALEALRQQDQGVSKEQWEAIAELQQRVDQALARGEASAQGMAQGLGQLSSMMDTQGNIQGLDQQKIAEELAKQMENQLADPRSKMGMKNRQKIAGALKKMRQGKPGEGFKQELESLREELESQCKKNGNGSKTGSGEHPGSGGVNRGRADAELTFGDEKKLEGRFKSQELENQFLSPQDLTDMGVTPLKPDTTPGQVTPQAARQYAPQQGTRASQNKITPSQREVIAQYFKEQ